MLWTDQDEVDPSGSDPEKADQFLFRFVFNFILYIYACFVLHCCHMCSRHNDPVQLQS